MAEDILRMGGNVKVWLSLQVCMGKKQIVGATLDARRRVAGGHVCRRTRTTGSCTFGLREGEKMRSCVRSGVCVLKKKARLLGSRLVEVGRGGWGLS